MIVRQADGTTVNLGKTENAPTISMTDYSQRVTDGFGVTTVVKRGFSRKLSARFAVPTDQADAIQRRLADLRATAALWTADARYKWLTVDGFYSDFNVDLAVPPLSYCSLTIEGLAETETVADTGIDPAPDGKVSTLQVIQPIEITDSVLLSSDVPENDAPAWAAGTTYALGAKVVRDHRVFESLTAGNVGNEPTGTAVSWLDTGPTNRWAMFDQALGTSTSRASSITVTLPAGQIKALALLDVVGASIRVQAPKASGPQYDRTIPVTGAAITFLDLPGVNGTTTITIAGSGAVSVGTLLAGRTLALGRTEASPTAGIVDYSKKEVDDFGEVTLVKRAWAKEMSSRSLIRSDALDVVANRLAALRAQPVLWIGKSGLDVLTVYGSFKDWTIEVGQFVSKLALNVEGLSAAPKVLPAPSTVSQGSADGVTWHLGLEPGDVFMRLSNDGGVNYGPAVRIVGEDGEPGEDGANQQLIFRRAATQPATPTGGGIPAGWSDGIAAGTELIWMSVQYQRNGIALGPWSTPAQIKGEPGLNAPLVLTQWSVTGTGGWHFDYADGDVFQRQSNDNGATWGAAVRVIGEGGEGGVDGTSPSNVFRRAASVPPTPADNTGNPPPGWSDGPPAGSDLLWQTKATFRGPTQLTSWSAPVRISGEAGATFPMLARGAGYIDGNKIGKGAAGTPNAYSDDVYSTQSFRGGAYLSFRSQQLVQSLLVGLSPTPAADQSYGYMAASWHLSGNGNCYAYTTDQQRKDCGSYDTSTAFAITYDGQRFRWYKDGNEVFFDAAAPDQALFFDSTFYQPNVGVKDVGFGPMPAASGSTLNLIPITPQTSIQGSGVAGLPPDGGWGTAAAVSRESYNGGCSATFTFPANGGKSIMAGLSQTGFSSDAGFGVITFALYQAPDGYTDARINGSSITAGPNIGTSSAVGKVDFDGRYVRWSINGNVFFTYDWMGTTGDPNAPENKLFFRCALASSSPRLDNIVFVPRGTAGKNGVDATPGAPGKDGTTWYNYDAYANSPDGTLDFTTGEPGTRAYWGKSQGTSPTEPGIPGLYAWTPYKGPPFGLAVRGGAAVAGDQIVRVSGSGWDADAYSTVSYRSGAAASFQFSAGGVAMAGLNTDPTADASYSSLDFAWYAQGDNVCSIYENGGFVATYGGYDANTKFMVQYDGRYIRYFKDGSVVRGPIDVGANLLYYFDSSLYQPNSRVTNIGFVPNGTLGADGKSALVAGPSQSTIAMTGNQSAVPIDGELPRTISNGATVNGVPVAIDSISNIVANNCTVTVVGSSIRFDTVGSSSASVSYKINASGQSVDASIAISVSRAPAPPPTASSATVSINNQTATTSTPTPKGGVVSLSTGGSSVTLVGSLSLTWRAPYVEASSSIANLYVQLYYRVAGGTWTAFGGQYNGIARNDDNEPEAGYLSVDGIGGPALSPNSTYEFAIYMWKQSVRNCISIYGNASFTFQ